MKKHILVLGLFMATFQCALGQGISDKVDIKWAPELEKKKDRLFFGTYLARDDSYIYSYRNFWGLSETIEGGSVTFRKFSKDLQLVHSKEHPLKNEGKDVILRSVQYFNDKIYLFTSFKNKKTRIHYFFAETLDKETFESNGDLKKLAEFPFGSKKDTKAGAFHLKMSSDSSKILVYYDIPIKKRQPEEYGFHVLDISLNEIWHKQVKLPYNEELFVTKDYEVGNNGDVYLLGKKYYRDPGVKRILTKKNGEPEYHYLILGYRNQGVEEKEYSLKTNQHFLNEVEITINQQQDIICAGFYTEDSEIGTKGSYFLKIDGVTSVIKEQSFNEFPLDFITKNFSNRESRKADRQAEKGKNVELEYYVLDHMIQREDGGILLVGGQDSSFESSYQVPNTGRTKSSITHYNNNIIVANLEPDGTVQWASKIAKQQTATSSAYLGYHLSVVGDKLYLLFNDKIRNLNFSGEGKPAIYGWKVWEDGNTVMLVEIDRDGNFSREALYTGRNRLVLERRGSVQISKSEFLFVGHRPIGKRFRPIFGIITFK